MKPLPRLMQRRVAALFVPTALALAACGGSDDPAAAAPPTPAPLSIGGTATDGAAIAGGSVDAACASGTGNAATGSDGGYALEIEGGALPCSLRVTSADGKTVLHSAATGSGHSARANLTPATELTMAQLHGRIPADVHAAFGADTQRATTAEAVQPAADAVVRMFADAGIALSGNPVSDALAIGDANDRALDTMKANLDASGTTLASVVQAVVTAVSGKPPANAGPSLPAASLLAAAASNCAALRSGKYRLVFFSPSGGAGVSTDTVTLDAPTLAVTSADGSETDHLSAAGACRYTLPNGGEMAVSSAGVLAFRSLEGGSWRGGIGFAEQEHPLSVFTGTWNVIGLADTQGNGRVHVHAGKLVVGTDGKATEDLYCGNLRDCVNETPDPRMVFTRNADGSFDFDGSRAFAYRAGSGAVMVVVLDADGSLALATPKAARTLPAIGSASRSVNLTINPQFMAPLAISDSESTTVSHAGDGQSYGRNAVIDFATGVTRPETIQINQILDGFIRRVPQQVTASDGRASNVSEWVGLTLRGMGFTAVALPSNNNLILSVTKP